MDPELPLAALHHAALRGRDGIERGTAVVPRYAGKALRYASVPLAARRAGARFELVLAAIYELAAETEP